MVIFLRKSEETGTAISKDDNIRRTPGGEGRYRDRVSGQSVAEMPGTFQEEHSRACTEEIYGGDRE